MVCVCGCEVCVATLGVSSGCEVCVRCVLALSPRMIRCVPL